MTASAKALFYAIIAGLTVGIIITTLPTEKHIEEYARVRAPASMRANVWLIMANNVLVMLLTLYGGVLFSLLEIRSYKTFPAGLYSFLDTLSSPLHRIFSFFDNKINSMADPMKSCYFISVSFPLGILFVNVMFFSNLVAYGIILQGINQQSIVALCKILPISLMEFLSLCVTAKLAYDFTQQNISLHSSNDTAAYVDAAKKYLTSKKNLQTAVMLSALLIASGILEHSMLNQ